MITEEQPGDQYGHWTLLRYVLDGKRFSRPRGTWIARCRCGKEEVLRVDKIRSKEAATSCGCMPKRILAPRNIQRPAVNSIFSLTAPVFCLEDNSTHAILRRALTALQTGENIERSISELKQILGEP